MPRSLSLSSAAATPFVLLLLVPLMDVAARSHFEIREATIADLHLAFDHNQLTSRALVEFYLAQIRELNPLLRAVIEVNPDALDQADRADEERRMGWRSGWLHGIPVLLKDIIGTRDRLNTTDGSLALVGSVVRRDAGVVERLRRAGAVILGKASQSEWCNFRSFSVPDGWNPRSGQGKNPYALFASPCGSSSGSAIAVAANMAAVSLGSETDGSIICPSSANGVVGIKPTVGLTSRSGVIPISLRMDTIGPIGRTVSDAVFVLEEIVGYDPRDPEATSNATKFIPRDGYRQFLKLGGLKGKRLGVLRSFFSFPKNSVKGKAFEMHFGVLREQGAILVDDLEVTNMSIILDPLESGQLTLLLADFKIDLNAYLSELPFSPVRSLSDVIAFNDKHRDKNTTGIGPAERRAIDNLLRLSEEGLEKLMAEENLDAVVTPEETAATILAIGGYPGITVPAGFGSDGVPFGITFGGLRGSEPKLIEVAYAFEQATKIRKPPALRGQAMTFPI